MKRIIILFWVLYCVALLCSCGNNYETPFDGLKDFPDIATVIERYGENYKRTSTQLIYHTYTWQGYDGKLVVFLDDYDGAVCAWKAEWTAYPEDVHSAFTKLTKLFNKFFGETYSAERNDTYFHYYWQDGKYYYGLVKRPSQGYVWAEMYHEK